MSTLGNDIRKIAKTKELEDKLKVIDKRLEILSQRGIGYDTSNGTASSSGTPGESTAPSGGGDKTSTTPSKVDENGNVINTPPGASNNPNDNSDQSSEENSETTTEGSSDAQGLFDNDSDAIGSKLSEITGLKDCNTGQDITLRLDGKFAGPSDGSWAEGSTPPDDTTWESLVNVVDDPTGAKFQSGQTWFNEYAPGYMETTGFTDFTLVEYETSPGSGVFFWAMDTATGGGTIRTASQTACSLDGLTCFIENPGVPFWNVTAPDYYNDVLKLSVNPTTGFIERSPYDGLFRAYSGGFPPAGSNNIGSTPQSDATFCFGNGRRMRVESNNLGGKTLYETTASGRPIGTGRVYNPNGILTAKVDAARGLAAYKP